jgi:pimeloyl-ACP methyl ester carboxylesterase
MKRFFFIVLLAGSFLTSAAQNKSLYTGTWDGTLDLGIKLRIVFHVKEDGKGGIITTCDSPDQSAFGIKCDTSYITDAGITIAMYQLEASFQGKLVNDSTLEGTFKQAASFPLTLKKTGFSRLATLFKPKPQEPKPPFPYSVYDVEYDNADKTVHFGATLTVPKPDSNIRYIKAPEYPAVILITGSGQQDRDETLLGHKPFAVIADHLSRNGIAVLRVDDRGMGKTKGDYKNATSADFAKDVEASIEFLKTQANINKNKIGLIGHSEGGMIAPIVAANRKDIAFMILLAAPGIPILDLMAEQNAAILLSSGIDEFTIEKYIPVYKAVVTAIIQALDSAEAKKLASKKMAVWADSTDPKVMSRLGLSDENSRVKFVQDLVPVVFAPWFRYFIAFDPQPYLQKITGKVLALNGNKDIQVISKSNLAGIKAALKKSKSGSYEITELDGLNHLFQHCKRCTLTEYSELEETFAPEVLKIMVDWLNKNIK